MPAHGADMHGQHMQMMQRIATGAPTMPGQDAFGALAEVVRILETDPATDWTKVDVERLRQHLIDMNEVVLRSEVKQTAVPGGLVMEIMGTGRTEQAIRAMVVPHAVELDRMPDWSAKTEPIGGGIRLTVLATTPNDVKAVARIRGLGFAGLLTEGGAPPAPSPGDGERRGPRRSHALRTHMRDRSRSSAAGSDLESPSEDCRP
jgi:hypothetical protein